MAGNNDEWFTGSGGSQQVNSWKPKNSGSKQDTQNGGEAEGKNLKDWQQERNAQIIRKVILAVLVAATLITLIGVYQYNQPENIARRIIKPLFEDRAMTIIKTDVTIDIVENTETQLLNVMDDNFLSFLFSASDVNEETEKLTYAKNVLLVGEFIDNYNAGGKYSAEEALYFVKLVEDLGSSEYVTTTYQEDIQSIRDHEAYVCKYIVETHINTMTVAKAIAYLESNWDLFDEFASEEVIKEYDEALNALKEINSQNKITIGSSNSSNSISSSSSSASDIASAFVNTVLDFNW
ncbi:hypothetical protein [Acetobacterium sp.]|jgi:hypothetical protein|uniref:hypothetical protein n=1 Tax=Acetobacterium sp. TaxID=1872094 RepID=UPI000CB78CAF|nr:hypothetical protein [Acetobacterium sp.]MDO9493423.1 hypothetical protein [Acetobacterium sp.]PKM75414.1 MAG: hypothetical protein CVU92_01450 [Firmicutes bacterium HGW-Firmicutes-17]